MALALAAVTMVTPAAAAGQPPAEPSSEQPATSPAQDAGNLPVSLDKIKEALAQPSPGPLRGLDEAQFKTSVSEKQTISVEDLIATMDFNGGPAVAGGVYAYEVNKQTFPAVDNPSRQPYGAFNQPELLTVVIENLAAKYLGGRALNAVSSFERVRAEQAARDDLQQAIADYWAARTSTWAAQISTPWP
ncbi:MAG TPA: hypothetical protein VG222_18975 [Vicinamibacterales bacterium]|jgi:hypothetical protein|nr:hypothetical protein [Vicinamibacterales bacterium]